MIIGTSNIYRCKDCPAFTWAGENMYQGDLGHYCFFTYHTVKSVDVPHITKCPLLQLVDKANSVEK